MEKVIVSKEQAEAIEFQLSKRSAADILATKAKHDNGGGRFIMGSAVLNDLTLDELARALYTGYEVEKTPEQELAEVYRYYRIEAYTTDMTAYADGIDRTLNILGIKIEGVNA